MPSDRYLATVERLIDQRLASTSGVRMAFSMGLPGGLDMHMKALFSMEAKWNVLNQQSVLGRGFNSEMRN